MPRPKPWVPRISQILKDLAAEEKVHLSRADIQVLFDIGRTAANDLMNLMGCTAPGSGYVSREAIMVYLRSSREGQEASREHERLKRLARTLEQSAEEAKYRNVPLPVSHLDQWTRLKDLKGITIKDGVMRVEFSSAFDLMGQLYRFVAAAGNEWSVFERLCAIEDDPGRKSEVA